MDQYRFVSLSGEIDAAKAHSQMEMTLDIFLSEIYVFPERVLLPFAPRLSIHMMHQWECRQREWHKPLNSTLE